ncbi:MAG: hypothetical protein K6A90_12325 [Lachnospiraceae bacterium]|nr:hypothetical protein [Lachnospiraceae bacterium]
MDCVNEILDRIGGDETTKFVFESMTPNENGMKIVTLSQRAGQVLAYGAVVKLILNKDDQAYTAHYVTAEGDYMYSIPVAEPGDAESVG